MKINQTPIRTSRNYAMNNFNIPETALVHNEEEKFYGVKIRNAENCKIDYKVIEKQNKPMSFELDNEIEKPNYELTLNIVENTENPIKIFVDFEKNNSFIGKIVLVVAENTTAQVEIVAKSNKKIYSNSFIKFICNKNSKTSTIFVSEQQNDSTSILNFENDMYENSKLDFRFIDFGCDYSIFAYYTKFIEDNVESTIKSLYLGSQKNKLDINILQDIYGKQGVAQIETVGALSGEAEKNFKGTINFNKGAKKSVGNESELCLMLSKKTKSRALPMLLCTEEDVDGSHSTAVGKIEDKELFYVMSRGFTKNEALRLMLKAKFNAVLNDIFDSKLYEEIIEKIDRKTDDENKL